MTLIRMVRDPVWLVIVVVVAFVSLAGCTLPETWAGDDYIGPLDRRSAARGERAGQTQLPKKPAVSPTGPLNVSITEAVLIGLENNRALLVERTNPSIRHTYEDQERAVFDPVLKAEAAASHEAGKTGAGGNFRTTSVGAGAAVAKRLPTGTDVEAGVTADQMRGAVSNNAVRAGLTVTQALLRGAGTDVNLASIRQARLDTLSSQYELRGFAEALVADIESTYWDYALAKRQIEIYEKSLKLAGDQLKEAEQRVNVGKLAATDLAAARAEVALRQEALINARSLLDTTRLRLLRLTSPPGSGLWQREVALKDAPSIPSLKLDDVEDHARLALKTRPDLNEARLRVRRDELELVKTKNGLLPKLDLFVSLGKTGYADSFGSAAGDLGNEYYDVSAGLSFEIPFGNRDAKAQHRRAVLTRQQAADAVANMEQLVQVDVRSSHVEVKRSAQQVAATSATREAQEEKVRAETEKFRVGKSTSLLVATVQRDLVHSQIAEVRAVVNHLKARIDLYRLDGSLLERRGIATPGRDPAD